MQPWQIGLAVTVFLFLAGHLGMAIWFASKMNERVGTVVGQLKTLTDEVKAMVKQEVRLGVIDTRLIAVEKACDELRQQRHG